MSKFPVSLVVLCLMPLMALANFMDVAEVEQEFTALEGEWVRCTLGQNENQVQRGPVIDNFPPPKNPTSSKLYERGLDELKELRCSQQRMKRLRSELVRLAQMNSDQPFVYSSSASIDFIYARDESNGRLLTRQEFIQPIAKKFFDGSRKFAACKELSPTIMTSPLKMHAFFLEHGYSCTAAEYKKTSMRVGGSWKAQQKLASAFHSLRARSITKAELDLTGQNIALVPHLSYERSQLNHLPIVGRGLGGEKLNYIFLKRKLQALGANVKVIYRNSTADIDTQARQTFDSLQSFADQNGEIILISRSFGAGVLNYMFSGSPIRTRSLSERVKSWINIGGTPYGSVIAEFKAREDQYFLRGLPDGLKVFNSLNGFAKFFLQFLVGVNRSATQADIQRFVDFGVNGLNSNFVRTMSHLSPKFKKIRKQGLVSHFFHNVKVFNVVYLIDDIFQRTESSDPVLQNMLAYGPTEGSAPLYGATVDSQGSVRTFLNTDHLAFRNMGRRQAENHILKILKAAQDSAFF